RRLGVDPDTLRAQNQRLIFAQLHAFADPEDESPAFDMVLQAEAGYLYMTGEPDRPPVRLPVAFVDTLAAHQLKEGILLALLHRERTGQGSLVQTSLLESALASLLNQAANYLMTGHVPQRMGTQHPNIAPYGDIFPCADGESVVLAVGTERQFERLCQVLGLKNLVQHPDFQTNKLRVENRAALNKLLAEAIKKQTLAELMQQFKAEGVPAARIRSMPGVFEMPAAQAMILEEKMADGTMTRRVKTVAFQLNSE
ncbi:MAG: CoA transferase, partial [Saprospiraceae bacterium]|nr:CoA transferase [Saprospiraceae bacterium]